MRKLLFMLTILGLIGGAFVENRFHLLPSLRVNVKDSAVVSEKPLWPDDFKIVDIESQIDTARQKAYFYKTKSSSPQPLIVSLHTWSNDFTQFDSINVLAAAKDYNYIHPNFRGVNNSKDACCSELVIADIDGSIDFALANANVDTANIFVIGMSGGGYATIATFMKSRHRIKKFSAWVPLVDLVRWHAETKIRGLKYTNEILACTESNNGELNTEVARLKSPINWKLPSDKLSYSQLDIYTGVYDGMEHNGVIPITHSINFYNKAQRELHETDSANYVSNNEKLALLEYREALGAFGSISGRKVVLKKEANNIQLTLFEGGHEILTQFAFEELIKP